MKNVNDDKTDLVSVILDDRDLLGVFAETLKIDEEDNFSIEAISTQSYGKLQTLKFYLWKKIKDSLLFLSNKVQTFAVLAEYHFKNEEKKIKEILTKH